MIQRAETHTGPECRVPCVFVYPKIPLSLRPPALPRGLSSALLSEHVWKAETLGGKEDEGSGILMQQEVVVVFLCGKSEIVARK